ncbi:MAG: hypothetical protein SA176_09880 [Edaphobacter sp.]|uniref:hypothetical protein n=1 Tax=Edaphobacter sp. TaxID=1934404 RepID=UPI00298229E2|nr:hypothetical protein [Edaphobacter sp.]MDW5266057.1 hypothetical protein [Edaphobacter sp.]
MSNSSDYTRANDHFSDNIPDFPITEVLDSGPHMEWSPFKKIAFRISAIFFALAFAAPLDRKFWRELFHTNFLHFQDLFRLTAAIPQYFYAPKWGFASFRNLYLLLLIAALGAALWSYLDRRRKQYDDLYYWLRVILWYRLAIGLIGYGLLQLFPSQFPKATLSDLHTNYGDYLQWKLYYLTNGVAHAGYEQAIGLLEVLGGALLLWQTTATIGAIISASLLFNIVLANIAYQLGDHVYALLLLLATSFLLAHDTERLSNLLIFQRPAKADHFRPTLPSVRAQKLRLIGKFAVVVFLGFYAVSVSYGFFRSNWPLPDTKGTLKDAAGYYNVREFEVNGRAIPYSLTDPVRWQNVVFEKWNTISIRSNRPLPIEVANPVIAYGEDQRKYEFAGNGGRRFYSYSSDSANGTIQLQGKNDPHEHIGFQYKYQPGGSLLLTGVDENGNALRVVLEKIDKKYLLILGRRNPLTIY